MYMAQFFVRGDMEPVEVFWYFWLDGKVVERNTNVRTGWYRHEWVGILLYTPDFHEELRCSNGIVEMTQFRILERTSGAKGVHPDDVPPEFKMQLLLMGVL